jgi:hypothetical protein
MNQSGTTVSATMHVNGSNCFDPLTTVRLTGTLTGGNISLTSTSVTGESIAFTGSIVNPVTFTGTYAIDGGCANGDRGSVTGSNIPSIASQMTGSFTTSGGDTFDMAGTVDQASDGSSDGTFALKGTLSFTTSCFSSGTITSGRFPSGSFIMGTSVALEIATGNGKITFLGTADEGNGSITGNYMLSGGTCDQTGTGMLVFSDPWGY